MKVIVAGNAASSHTLNIASSLVKSDVECEVHSMKGELSYQLHRRYIESNVKVFLHKDATTFKLNVLKKSEEVGRIIAIGGHSYGLHVAQLTTKVMRTLILLGTEVTHQQATRPEVTDAYCYFDAIVVPSNYLGAKVSPFIKNSKTNLFVEPLGVQPVWEQKHRVEMKVSPFPFSNYFVTAKAFKWIYGQEDIIYAAASISKTLRDTDTGFVFVGGGTERLRLMNLAKKMLIEDRILFLENMDSAELVKIVDNAITAIYPSEYESFGLSLAEAITRGKKPITYDIPGYKEVTNSFKHSISVEHNNVGALSRVILACISKPQLCQQNLPDKELGSLSWTSLSRSYADACIGLKQKPEQKRAEVSLFLNKYDMFNIQQRKRNLSGARLQRTYELYREFERQGNLIHVATGNQENALSIIDNIDFDTVKVVYIEHGSIYSKLDNELDEKIFAVAKQKNIRVVYFISDYHAFDITYLKSLKYIIHKYWLYKLKRSKQRDLLRGSKHITLALPSVEINSVFNVDEARLLELPPACRGVQHFPKLDSMEREWSFVYGGGVGPFYLLQRFLLASEKARRRMRLYIRRKDYQALDPQYKSMLEVPSAKMVFDQDMRSNIIRLEQVGVMLMEPIDYIRTSFPVKFFDYLESGIPILAYENTKIGDVVSKYGLGWTVKPSVESICEFAMQETLELVGFEGRRVRYLSENKWAHRVESILGPSNQS